MFRGLTLTGISHFSEVGQVHFRGQPNGYLIVFDCLRILIGHGKISDGYQHRLSSVQMETDEVWIRMRQKSLMIVVGNSLLTCKSPFNRGAVKSMTRVLACSLASNVSCLSNCSVCSLVYSTDMINDLCARLRYVLVRMGFGHRHFRSASYIPCNEPSDLDPFNCKGEGNESSNCQSPRCGEGL